MGAKLESCVVSQRPERLCVVPVQRSVFPAPLAGLLLLIGDWALYTCFRNLGISLPLAGHRLRRTLPNPLPSPAGSFRVTVISHRLIFLLFVPTENPNMMKNTQNPNSEYLSPTDRSFPSAFVSLSIQVTSRRERRRVFRRFGSRGVDERTSGSGRLLLDVRRRSIRMKLCPSR